MVEMTETLFLKLASGVHPAPSKIMRGRMIGNRLYKISPLRRITNTN